MKRWSLLWQTIYDVQRNNKLPYKCIKNKVCIKIILFTVTSSITLPIDLSLSMSTAFFQYSEVKVFKPWDKDNNLANTIKECSSSVFVWFLCLIFMKSLWISCERDYNPTHITLNYLKLLFSYRHDIVTEFEFRVSYDFYVLANIRQPIDLRLSRNAPPSPLFESKGSPTPNQSSKQFVSDTATYVADTQLSFNSLNCACTPKNVYVPERTIWFLIKLESECPYRIPIDKIWSRKTPSEN